MGDPMINVETGELNNFAREVRHHAGNVLEPAVAEASRPMASGVAFGVKNVSGAVLAAKTRYAQSLDLTQANLEQFVEAAKILAAAAEKVAADFDAVDLRSAEAVDRVNHLLYTAAKEAEAARLAADRAQYRHGPAGPAAAI